MESKIQIIATATAEDPAVIALMVQRPMKDISGNLFPVNVQEGRYSKADLLAIKTQIESILAQ